MSYIYKIQNDINDKVYIGKTLYTIERRWHQHKNNSTKNYLKHLPIYAAINKYGLEHFSIIQIEEVKDYHNLSNREQYWINQYDSYLNGYNATKGGDGKILYDHNEIIELYKLGYSALQISEKIKCDRTLVTRVLRANGIKSRGISKMIDQFDLVGNYIQTFDSTNDAAEWIRINGLSSAKKINSYISDCCSGRRSNIYGYIWKYKDLPKL